MIPVIIYTLGDPAGIGPDLLFQADLSSVLKNNVLLVVGPERALEQRAGVYGQNISWNRISTCSQVTDHPGRIFLLEPPGLEDLEFKPGKGDVRGGMAAGKSLEAACSLIKNGQAKALVTGPLNKAFLLEAGFRFGGHTEFLADFFQVDPDMVCMHLCGELLRVSLVTTHPPLSRVPEMITLEKVFNCLELTYDFILKLGLDKPIAVCGLNPHAGEQGRIGHEEETVIKPAIIKARQHGINAQGPFPADTVFLQALRGKFSAVLAMYHDQGLGPLKLVDFGRSVNVTLGLPMVRTSVDHGTAYDLASTGKADPHSLERAFELALKLSDRDCP